MVADQIDRKFLLDYVIKLGPKEVIGRKFIDNFIDKFEKKENGCWEWMSCLNHRGYGKVMVKGKVYPAHRISYLIFKDDILDDLLVLHKCDNPKCVNPDHLFLGTQKDNMRDMINKGRKNQVVGETAGNNKLTEKEVLEIRQMYIPKVIKMKDIAKIYNISDRQVSSIINRKQWKHL